MSTIALVSVTSVSPEPQQHLVFGLGAEEYAIDAALVEQLRTYDNVTLLAGAPHWLLGIINLRDRIVPLVDLRLRFGQPDPLYDASTVVIVLSAGGRHAAMVVDRIAGVVQVAARCLQPLPPLTALPASALAPPLLGMTSPAQRRLAVLDGAALLCELDTPIYALAA